MGLLGWESRSNRLEEQHEPKLWEEEGANSVEDVEDGDREEEHEPEPEEEVDLLVDDVLREDAEAVVGLLVACCSDVGDVAGNLGGEDGAERVPEEVIMSACHNCPDGGWRPEHEVPVLSVPEAPAVVLDHLQPEPTELVVEETVDEPELDNHQQEVEELAEYEVAKVPVVVVKYRLEVLGVPLDHRFDHHTVIVLLLLGDHDGSLAVCAEAGDEPVLEDAPDVVGCVEDPGVDGHDEGDPLVVGGVRSIVHALDPLQLDDALHVGLVLGRDVGSAVDPAVVLRQVRVDALELAADGQRQSPPVYGMAYLMGSPKYWVAMPTVAPVMQITELAL